MADESPNEPPARGLISYAQNFEDIMLFRALANVQNGRYVDVGAAWPEFDSVTRLFYERGWSGINVEPNPELFEALVKERPRDTNLELAIGSDRGRTAFAVVVDTGLSTLDETAAERHRSDGRQVELIEVEVKPLESVLDAHMPEGEIHFLKVDVEGAEAAVLAGNDWSRFRPWIVVVELINVASEGIITPPWERELVEAGYSWAYDDGINRFYVADEHADLKRSFSVPPNVLDGFVTLRQAQADDALVAAGIEAQRLEWLLDIESSKLATAETRIEWLERELAFHTDRFDSEIAELRDREREFRDRERELRLLHADARADSSRRQQLLGAAQLRADGLTRERDLLQAHVNAVMQSRSWQLTRPVRLVYSLAHAPGPTSRAILVRILGQRRAATLARLIAPLRRGASPRRDAQTVARPLSPREQDYRVLLDASVDRVSGEPKS